MRNLKKTMLTTNDLYWIAGFLEGEGCFSYRRQMRVFASQVQREPLEKLQSLLGGGIYLNRNPQGFGHQPIYQWNLGGPSAAGLIMTIYELLSTRRKYQALSTLSLWKSRPVWPKYRTQCVNGHTFTPENTYNPPASSFIKKQRKGTVRTCRLCRKQAQIRFTKRKQEVAHDRRGTVPINRN